MKHTTLMAVTLRCAAAILVAGCLAAHGQSYTINWHKVSAGGGASANGQFSLAGTIGQPDAGGGMSGGQYSLKTGFWSLLGVVQTPDSPNLVITRSAGSVVLSWSSSGNYTLQQSSNLSIPGGWSASLYPVSTANGTNSVTITALAGTLFFRLKP